MLFIKDYQERPSQLADHLTYAVLPFDAYRHVMVGKDSSFMCCIRYRGPDMESITVDEMDTFQANVNDILMRMGDDWGQHWDAWRKKTEEYHTTEWNNAGSFLFDKEREGHAKQLGAQFETEWSLTLTFLPPSDRVTVFEMMLEEPEDDETPEDRIREKQVQAIEYFDQMTTQICDLMKSRMGQDNVRFLEGAEIITYLRGPIHNDDTPVDLPEVPMFLDVLIGNREVSPGTTVGLGYEQDDLGVARPQEYVSTVAIRGWPRMTKGNLLERLNNLNIEYRWVTRALPLSKQSSIACVTEIMDRWGAQRKGIRAIIAERIFDTPAEREEPMAVANHIDSAVALRSVSENSVNMAFVTPVINVYGKTKAESRRKARMVMGALSSEGFVCQIETFNAFEAWLGSLPGQCYPNVRQAPINTMNLAHIAPLAGVWAGYHWNEHLKAEPLMRAFTNGSTPFRVSFHHGDVGHVRIYGPNGAGKSVLMSSVAYQWFRYEGARIFAFDKDRSIRACTLFCGGKFHELGERGSRGIGFQPLANIDQPDELTWARDWLVDLYRAKNVEITTDDEDRIYTTLVKLSKRLPHERNLKLFQAVINVAKLKMGINDYVEGGAYGHLLDADTNELTPHHFHAFEMGALMKSPALVPVLTYLFRWINNQIDENSTPTLILLDESWLYLKNTLFATQLEEWLKTLRKKNASVIFATQSLGDVTGSIVEKAAHDNCFTKIYLPNPAAMEGVNDPEGRGNYHTYLSHNLNPRQIANIAGGIMKREYYYVSDKGVRMFELGLGDLGIALAGSSAPTDHLLMDAILDEFGQERVLPAFLVAKELHWAAEMIEPGASDRYPDAETLLQKAVAA